MLRSVLSQRDKLFLDRQEPDNSNSHVSHRFLSPLSVHGRFPYCKKRSGPAARFIEAIDSDFPVRSKGLLLTQLPGIIDEYPVDRVLPLIELIPLSDVLSRISIKCEEISFDTTVRTIIRGSHLAIL